MIKRLRDILFKVLTTHAAWPILICIALLCTASIFALELSSPDRADRQKLFVLAGAAVLLLALLPNFLVIGRAAYVLYALSILLLFAVLFAPVVAYTHRWFVLPGNFQFQPSELAKITFVLAMASYLRYRRNIRQITGLLGPFLIMLVPFVSILIEPDLGTAMLFPLVLYAMLIAAGARLRHLLIVTLVAIITLPGVYPLLQTYQQKRIQSIVLRITGRQDSTRLKGEDYQQYMSEIAIGAGGLTGSDEAVRLIQQNVLPEAHTDFIFAIVGARWGLLGCALVIAMYLAFLASGIEIAATSRDPFGRLIVVGLSSLILFQAMINIAMTIGLGPVVGIALPFLSYGGSSLLTSMLAAGLLLNVSVRRNTKSVATLQHAGV